MYIDLAMIITNFSYLFSDINRKATFIKRKASSNERRLNGQTRGGIFVGRNQRP